MNKKQMNELADLIVDKIMKHQIEYDEKFKEDLAEISKQNPELEYGTITQQELIEQELNDLYLDLKELENAEEYAKASVLLMKIEKYKKKYNL
tara:strand:+ start:314 stop:592 length:279 start_codon:yes stop_codon:yes gene_type:complete